MLFDFFPSFPSLSLSLAAFFFFFFFLRSPLRQFFLLRVLLLPHSETERGLSSLFHLAFSLHELLMRWWILSRAGDVSHYLSNPQPHLTVIGFGPWLRGACQPDFLCRSRPESEGFLWGNGYRVIIHHPRLCPGPSGTLPRQQSISAAIHHRPECSWEEEGSETLRPSASGALMKALALLSYKHLSDIKLGQLSCRSQPAIKVRGPTFWTWSVLSQTHWGIGYALDRT